MTDERLVRVRRTILILMASATATAGTATSAARDELSRHVPAGHDVLSSTTLSIARPARTFRIVALRRSAEDRRPTGTPAPARQLLIFERRKRKLVLVGRNDTVILRADEGGQCDPFLDGGGTISVRGRYFTVENGVACGQHWTDFVTFRLDDRAGFVFHTERSEAWTLNPSDDPNAEALVRVGPQHVRRARPGAPTAFSAWRRTR